jgi:class 3 adenylate cyclase
MNFYTLFHGQLTHGEQQMSDDKPRRKMAVILASDMVGFSKAIGEDEAGTLKKLKESRAHIDKAIAAHYGRIFNTAGDSVIAEFSSPVDAVTAAIEFQKLLKQRNAVNQVENQAHFRVGINLGDVIIQGNDLMGEGINIAARLESIGIPGGICISHSVHAEVRKRFDSVAFYARGPQMLKNIEDPIDVFDISIDKSPIKYEAPKPTDSRTPTSPPQGPAAAPEVTKEMKGLMLQALQGDLGASYQLGYIYENGEGVAVNETEAIRWYTKAATNGSPESQFNLAMMMEQGRGCPVNLRKAFYWYEKAANQGDIEAQFNLGVCLTSGKGCDVDIVQAHMWFSLAARKGDSDSISNRDILLKRLKPEQVVQSKQLVTDWMNHNA